MGTALSPSPLRGEGRGEGRVLAEASSEAAFNDSTKIALADHTKSDPTLSASVSESSLSPPGREGRGVGSTLPQSRR